MEVYTKWKGQKSEKGQRSDTRVPIFFLRKTRRAARETELCREEVTEKDKNIRELKLGRSQGNTVAGGEGGEGGMP